MKKGSILILSPWPSIFSMGQGGTPRERDLVEALLAVGYTIDYVAAKGDEGNWMPTHERLRAHRFGPLRFASNGRLGQVMGWLERTTRLVTRSLTVAIRHGRPDVIYAMSSLTIPAGVLAGFLLRRPTIGALFGTFLFPHLGSGRDRLAHFEELIAFKCPVARLLIVNDGTRGDEVARALGVPDSRVRFWMHGLDLEACDAAREAEGRAELQLPTNVPLIVSSSRLVAWKRVDRIIRAIPTVLDARPDAMFAFSGEGQERQALTELARALSVEHAVRFLGGLQRDKNLRLIASADVFVALYDYSCVGVALLEALGCGVATVVADTGATRDFVENDGNGLVVNPDDTGATAAAIIRLVNDPQLRRRLGDTARRHAEERFLTRGQRASLELDTIAELAPRGDRPVAAIED